MKLTFHSPTLPIGEIRITKAFSQSAPHLDKLKACMEFYRANDRFDRQIIVDHEKYLHDGYCAYLVAQLMGVERVKVLMVGEKAKTGIPVTELVKEESKPEPMNLYCVKSDPGWLTKGEIYDFSNGTIIFDNGWKGRDFKSLEDFLKVNNYWDNSLYRLVKRPAKVGEWIYPLEDCPFGRYKKGELLKCTKDDENVADVWSGKAIEYNDSFCVIEHDDYLVLDGYDGRYEKETT